MSSIYGFTGSKEGKVSISRSQTAINIGDKVYSLNDMNPTLARFNEFWELMDSVKRHGYLRAAISTVGKSAVGAWWNIVKHEDFGDKAPDLHRKRLTEFYMYTEKRWDNIKDYQNFSNKLLIGVEYLKFFGQTAFYIVRNKNGTAIGLDHITGLVVPNVDDEGYFRSGEPSFVQYPTSNPSIKINFNNPTDIVYLANPDFAGSPLGASDVEALASYTLPIDFYLQTAAREYLKNRDRPEVVYSLPQDISEEAFDAFVAEVDQRWRGASNTGHSPIAVQGEFEVKELRELPQNLPYQESRKESREEELAVMGVSGAKLGITESMSSANIKEIRREFHESSMQPLFKSIELGFYEQIHVREFRSKGWVFKFNNPDFMNAVETATVHMRYHDLGVLTPNEIRYDLGMEARTDPEGDKFVDEKEEQDNTPPPGSPPEGREGEPDDPSQTGEPTNDDQDPPRGDQHDEDTRQNILRELRSWKSFAINRVKKGREVRDYRTSFIPEDLRSLLQGYVSSATSVEELATLFGEAISIAEEELNHE